MNWRVKALYKKFFGRGALWNTEPFFTFFMSALYKEVKRKRIIQRVERLRDEQKK